MAAGFDIQDNVLIKYTGTDTDIEIPEGVVKINERVFEDNKRLTSVVMPDSVLSIGTHAFEKCLKLKTVKFSVNLKEIGYDCFCGCKALTEIELPETLEEVGSGAFAGCVKLKKITCDSKVYKGGSDPFYSYDEKYPEGIADKDGYVIFAGTLFKYLGSAKDITIPEGVNSIAGGVFGSHWGSGSAIKSVVIPDSVKYIGNNAFLNCKKLVSVTMPSEIEFGDHVFDGCPGLLDENGFFVCNGIAHTYKGNAETVIVPEGTKVITDYLFCGDEYYNPGNRVIHTVQLPDGLEEIGAYAFKNCDLLESIIIPDGVKKIGAGAFEGCDHLVSVSMPENVDEMGDGIFSGCRGLADENGFIIQNNVIHSFYGGQLEVVIPEGIKAIASGVFDKSRITSVKLPSTLTSLGSSFQECGFLTEIVIPERITEIRRYTFKDCVHLKKVSLPASLENIGYSAFSNCESLEEIDIPNDIKRIEEHAFQGCTSLKAINIPGSIKVVESYTFNGCTSLEKVVLCEGLKKINDNAFSKCSALSEITIPDSVEYIGDDAFANCTALKKVTCSTDGITIHQDAFTGCTGLADENGMTIVAGILWKYDGPGGEVTVPEGVTTIGPNSFREGYSRAWRSYASYRQTGSLTAVTLPSSLRKIEKNAFEGCVSLKEIEIPEGVCHIGEEAFRGCGSLQHIKTPSTLSSIGKRAFYECNDLKEFIIPSGMKTIADETFYGCKSIKSIEIPKDLEEVGMDAFRDCSKLTAVNVVADNRSYSSEDGMLLNKSGDELITCPPGKQLEEYTIPSKIKTIGAHAFISCKKLKKIVVPATVESIGDEAFPRGKTLKEIEVEPGAGKVKVGVEVFDIFKENTPLVYPKLPVTFIKEQKTQVCLGLGFCMNPDKYEGEYAELYQKYAKSHEKTLTKKADSLSLVSVAKYFSAIPASETAKKKEGTINYKKLSPKAKVDMLESAVLENDIEKAKTVIEGCGEFEFTPRALGLACLYSDVEMVKLLVENGATFKYKYDPSLKRKYGAAYATKYTPYPVNYSELIARTDIDVYNPMIFASTHDYHFGTLPKISAKENSEEVRADIAEYLVSEKKAEFDSIAALFYAILWGSTKVAQRLMEKGVTLPSRYLSDLYDTGSSISRNEVLVTLPRLSEKKCIYAMKSFVHLLEGTGKQMILTQRVFDDNPRGKNAMLNAEVLECLFAETDTSKINKSKVLEMVIDTDDVKALKAAMDTGVIKTTTQRDKAIAYATKNKKNDVLAWLMDYKNRTADVAVEAAKEEKKMMRELTENPNSVSALKKKWGYKKLDDGTLVISSYKGADEIVEVPSMIGKSTVTAIGNDAFSASSWARSNNQENRSRIKTVILPEGIQEIGEDAFRECVSLETIIIPSTLKRIKERAFWSCKRLKEIEIPGNVNVSGRVFFDCPSLFDQNGFIIINGVLYLHNPGKKTTDNVVIPDNIKVIGEGAFAKEDIKEICIPAGVKRIRKGAFENTKLEKIVFTEGLTHIEASAFSGTKIEEIHIPNSVTSIGANAFDSCSELKDIYISSNVKTIGKDLLGVDDNYNGYDSWRKFKPSGIYVHTPAGSVAAEYMKRYSGVFVANDYDEKEE